MPRISSGRAVLTLAVLGTLGGVLLAGSIPCDANAASRGRIHGISFFGNRVTKKYVLLRELGFRVGDEYVLRQVNEARERLESLEFISYADIQTKRPRPGEVHLLVQVEEVPRVHLAPLLEYDERQEGFLVGAEMGVLNFRGRGETLEMHAAGGAAQSYRLRWENPWILGPLHLGLSLEGAWDRYEFVYEPFRLTETRAGLGLQRQLGRWLRAGVSYKFRRFELDYATDVPTGRATERDDPVVAFTLEHDSRDLPVYPRRGVRAQLGLQLAGLADGDRYRLYDASVASFLDPLWGLILGTRVAWRGTSAPVPLYARSYFSGWSDVRGIPDGSVRGDEHFLASAELRWPAILIPMPQDDGTISTLAIGLHGFHDWGKAWRYGAAFDDATMERTFGLGLHFVLEELVLRCEWSRTADGENRFLFGDSFTF